MPGYPLGATEMVEAERTLLRSQLARRLQGQRRPPLAAASPSATGDTSPRCSTPSVTSRCFYMDYRDGTEKWETFLAGPFRQHLQRTYDISPPWAVWFLALALKHPELFGGVAALEPGIEPIQNWKEMQPRRRFWRGDTLF